MNTPSIDSQDLQILLALIREYHDTVLRLSRSLASALQIKKLMDWRSMGVAGRGTFFEGCSYAFHGAGCSILTPEIEVDFDFGFNGETGGFDVWRLWSFICDNDSIYRKFPFFSDKEMLTKVFDIAVAANVIEKQGDLFYLKQPA